MNRSVPLIAAFVACLAFNALVPLALHSQDPFGDFGDDPFGTGGENPFGAAPAPQLTAEASVELDNEDPLVLAILQSNLNSPHRLVQAVENLLNLNRPNKAKELIAAALGNPPPTEVLEKLARRFGSAVFLRIAQEEGLAPEGRQFAELVLTAADNARREGARLTEFADQATGPSPVAREIAINELRKAGEDAAVPLVEIMGDSVRASAHELAQRALIEIGSASVEPLLAVLTAPDENLRIQAITVLGFLQANRATNFIVADHVDTANSEGLRIAAGEALVRIVGARPNRAGAEKLLWRRANEFFDRAPPLRADENNMIALWRWDDSLADGAPLVRIKYRADDAALLTASRLAADLYRLDAGNEAYSQLYLITRLESEKLAGGLFRPLGRGAGGARELAASLGPDFLETTLALAIERGATPAAIAAVEVLGEIGDVSLLDARPAGSGGLLDALQHKNRRLAFAAAQAIMRIDPRWNFAGASQFTQTIGFLARSRGVRRVLVAHPHNGFGQTLVGMLNELGFEADTAATGREAFKMATVNPDYEFIMLSDAINDPPISHLIQQIRRDHRTASTPIGLLTRQERALAGEALSQQYERVLPLPQPRTPLGTSVAIKRLQQFWDREFVTKEERLAHAASAYDWAILLMSRPGDGPSYNFLAQQHALESGLFTDALADRAAQTLGLLGSPQAQRSLVSAASNSSQPIDLRRIAADAFLTAVRRRHLLLTTSEIRQQYDRYNRSETAPPETQQVLGAILDAIELPSQGGKGNAAEAAPTKPTEAAPAAGEE